ncbi:956_t:CDS:2, partial [Gigaspora margarita]
MTEHIDLSQEPIVKVNQITNNITHLPTLSNKQQNELTKVLIEYGKRDQIIEKQFIGEVCRLLCATHTLQISVKEELKQVAMFTNALKAFKHFLPTKASTKITRNADTTRNAVTTKNIGTTENVSTIEIQTHKMLNKYSPLIENDESVKNWIALIYGSLSESSDNYKSVSSRDKAKCTIELEDTNTIKYLPSMSYKELLKKGISDKAGLKASMLDPLVLKLLPFATNMNAQSNQNNNNTGAVITVKKEEYDSLSAKLWVTPNKALAIQIYDKLHSGFAK